jgi:L-ascorbate metabolism protein UlaG (beta-lactamase superfamily)
MSYRLKSFVAIEPLVGRYFASPYLLAPLSAPRLFRHLVDKLLRSFVTSPRAHEMALKNPAFRGGPFVSLLAEDVEKARSLFEELRGQLARQFETAQALDELHALLKNAQGESLDLYYAKVPAPFAGLIELYYDRSGHANYRFIESLVYNSPLYDRQLQGILLRPLRSDGREFVLTTPRLENEESLLFPVVFDSPALDQLARSREFPVQDLRTLAQDLKVDEASFAKFADLFETVTEDATPARESTTGEKLRCRYFGHACVELSRDGYTVLVDPLLSYGQTSTEDGRLTLGDLPETLDALVITHLHLDHFNIETLLNIRYKTKTVIVPKVAGGSVLDPSPKRLLQALGFTNVIELDACEEVSVGSLQVQALPFQGEHGDLNITSKSAFVVGYGASRVFLGADVRFASEALVQRVARAAGEVNSLFIGMECEGAPLSWVYGALLDEPLDRSHDKQRRLNGSNCNEARAFLTHFRPKKVNIYALGKEPWLSHIMSVNAGADSFIDQEIRRFEEECRGSGVSFQTLYLKHEELWS